MSASEKRARWGGPLRRVLAVVIGLLAVAYFAREVARYWPGIVALAWTRAVAGSVVLACALQLMGSLVDGLSWGWLLRGLGIPAKPRDALAVFLVSQFAKYLPGNVGQHVGRVALARSHGWRSGTIVLSLVVENGFALAVGALFAAIALFLGVSSEVSTVLRVAAAVALIVLGWVSCTLLLKHLLARPPGWLKRLLGLEQPIVLGRKLVFGYLASHITSYAALGAGLVVVVLGLGGGFAADLLRVALAAVVGWFAGYLVPGSPAGLGVREAAVTAVLTPLYGPAVAASSALLWRLSALLADIGLFLCGLGLRSRPSSGPA